MRRARLGQLLPAATLAVLLTGVTGAAGQTPARHTVTGMVIEVHSTREQFVVSHEDIPGVMTAMTMPFEVRDSKELEGVVPGARVTFTLVVGADSSHAEGVRILRYESMEQDPLTARRLQVLTEIVDGKANPHALDVGQAVPDFELIDQARRKVRLSELRGRVVAVNFIYTSCVQPQFCFRVANHFGALQRRFPQKIGRDLVLLTVTFDPVRDTPETLAEYARTALKADPEGWRLLTGDVETVRRVCSMFGVDYFPDEGLMNHSSHTAVIDRHGTLVANIEGNEFTTRQLGDLVETVLRR